MYSKAMGQNSKPLSNQQEVITFLAAQGQKTSEIASALGLKPATIRNILKDEKVAFEVRRLRYKLFGKGVKQRFDELVPLAQEAVAEILENPNSKAQLRFQAAQEVMDRALGKPKQTVEHEGSIIKALYDKLDGRTREENFREAIPVDIEVPALLENPNTISEKSAEKEKDSMDSIDAWSKEFL